jgi:hypothetical protein
VLDLDGTTSSSFVTEKLTSDSSNERSQLAGESPAVVAPVSRMVMATPQSSGS